jgi:hypothetical protein
VEIDKSRQFRAINDAVAFLKAEELGENTDGTVSKMFEFKYLDIMAGTYHGLSPNEYLLWCTNFLKVEVDADKKAAVSKKKSILESALEKLSEVYKNPELCIVVE